MYIPKCFKNEDFDSIKKFIDETLMQQYINQAIELDEHTLALLTAEYQQAWRIYERL